ncbi:n-glycosylase dna lyase [Ceraceosorus bombacis]|uniref:DNA-(apurinic or apyrimidinic site) lyase n=1 Tax=Ceraceosorus bombacis TaxID=401625 RepID=A0A0P1B9U9_9BASI|nr:n-glycosylase dna lyase [Ceraceosorus bombacis]
MSSPAGISRCATFAPGSPLIPPRPPPGYASLRVLPSEILLELTISNRCGQAFRWRANDVWEPVDREEAKRDTVYPAGNSSSVVTKDESLVDAAVANRPIKADPDENDTSSAWPDAEHDDVGVKAEHGQKKESTSSLTGDVEWQRWTEYSMALSDRVILLRQDVSRGYVYHRTRLPDAIEAQLSGHDYVELYERGTDAWLRDYLNLRVPLDQMYQEWADKDKVFARFAKRFAGVRMLRQDPWECLCAFICSSNNNIARIGQMVMALSHRYSPPLLTLEYPPPPPTTGTDATSTGVEAGPTRITYHPFPAAAALTSEDVEGTLRSELAFGYRAKYIWQTARVLAQTHVGPEPDCGYECRLALEGLNLAPVHVTTRNLSRPATPPPTPRKRKRTKTDANRFAKEGDGSASTESSRLQTTHSPTSFLHSLRSMTYPGARAELIKFQGVGPKVADCILLMSMDQPSSIPVDRHVYQFAARWYGMRVKEGTKGYEELADRFRQLWGEYAGWAHSVIFTADLRSFQNFKVEAVKGEKVKQEDLSSSIELPGLNTIDAKPFVPTPPTAPLVAAQPEYEMLLKPVDKSSYHRPRRPVSRRVQTLESASAGKEPTHRSTLEGKASCPLRPSSQAQTSSPAENAHGDATPSTTMADRVKITRRKRA